ncbi:MAG: ParA family protein [Rhizobiaceae bacterium]
MPQGAVIAAANAKGGCGKTTTILILAGEYAAQGYRVHIIDADPRRRAVKWAGAEIKPASITASEANATNIRAEIEKASKEAEVVLIDVEGTANAALTLAVAYANAVIIPAQMSPPDVEDGLTTIRLVQDMGHAARRAIPYGLLWSNVPPAIRSREMANLESQVAAAGVPVIGRVFQRSAFAAIYSFATTLDELPPAEVPGIEKAKADVIRLTDALDSLMKGAVASNATNEAAA